MRPGMLTLIAGLCFLIFCRPLARHTGPSNKPEWLRRAMVPMNLLAGTILVILGIVFLLRD